MNTMAHLIHPLHLHGSPKCFNVSAKPIKQQQAAARSVLGSSLRGYGLLKANGLLSRRTSQLSRSKLLPFCQQPLSNNIMPFYPDRPKVIREQILDVARRWHQSSCEQTRSNLRSNLMAQIEQLLLTNPSPALDNISQKMTGTWSILFQSGLSDAKASSSPLTAWYPMLQPAPAELLQYNFFPEHKTLQIIPSLRYMEQVVAGISTININGQVSSIPIHLSLTASWRQDRKHPNLFTANWRQLLIRYKTKSVAQYRLQVLLEGALSTQPQRPIVHLPKPIVYRCLYVDSDMLILSDFSNQYAVLTSFL